MTQIDWTIVAFAGVFALLGYRQGLIVGALSLVGFIVGAYLGIRLAPTLLARGTASGYAPVLELAGGIIGGAVLATALERIARRIRGSLLIPGIGLADGLLGALFGAVLALGVAWIIAAAVVALRSGPSLREAVQRSVILRNLDEVLPSSGGVLSALARLDPLPTINGPGPSVAPPSGALAGSPALQRDLPSIVRVVGTACGVGIEGSGWVAAPETVVTNAHVVAGEQDTSVQIAGHPEGLAAQVIEFDPHDDVAVLHVGGLQAPALALARSAPGGREGEIVGYPEGGPLAVDAARIGQTQTVQTNDAYGNGPVERAVTPIRGLIRSGNSGGPVIDSEGDVLTMVFARALGSGPASGYGVADGAVLSALDRGLQGRGRQSSGLCAHG